MEPEASQGHEFVDTVHRILSNRHRRRILQYLDGEEGATMGELVDWLASEGQESAAPDRERIEIQLDHTHLPLLAEAGTIEYDDERIALTSHGQVAADVRRTVDEALEER